MCRVRQNSRVRVIFITLLLNTTKLHLPKDNTSNVNASVKVSKFNLNPTSKLQVFFHIPLGEKLFLQHLMALFSLPTSNVTQSAEYGNMLDIMPKRARLRSQSVNCCSRCLCTGMLGTFHNLTSKVEVLTSRSANSNRKRLLTIGESRSTLTRQVADNG